MRIVAIFVLILVMQANKVAANDSVTPKPGPDLKPQQVVEIILEALARNDSPYKNAGIEITFNFAAPSNKVNTGPLNRFIGLLHSESFIDMIDHQTSEISEVVLKENKAYLLVSLVSKNNREVRYAFQLGLQKTGEYNGMWMTEAVSPLSDSGKIGA